MAQSRHKQPTVGLRVEKGLQEAFATLAREKFKTTPSKLLTAIFEAAVTGKSNGQDLNIKIRLTAGATKDEVESIIRKEIAAAMSAGTSVPAITDKPAAEAAAYSEEQAQSDDEKRLTEEFKGMSPNIGMKDKAIFVPESFTVHDSGASLKKVLSEMGLSRDWLPELRGSKVTKPGGELTMEIATEFKSKFSSAWVASRLKK